MTKAFDILQQVAHRTGRELVPTLEGDKKLDDIKFILGDEVYYLVPIEQKTDGYFIECGKCGSYDIKSDKNPVYDGLSKKVYTVHECQECGFKNKIFTK